MRAVQQKAVLKQIVDQMTKNDPEDMEEYVGIELEKEYQANVSEQDWQQLTNTNTTQIISPRKASWFTPWMYKIVDIPLTSYTGDSQTRKQQRQLRLKLNVALLDYFTSPADKKLERQAVYIRLVNAYQGLREMNRIAHNKQVVQMKLRRNSDPKQLHQRNFKPSLGFQRKFQAAVTHNIINQHPQYVPKPPRPPFTREQEQLTQNQSKLRQSTRQLFSQYPQLTELVDTLWPELTRQQRNKLSHQNNMPLKPEPPATWYRQFSGKLIDLPPNHSSQANDLFTQNSLRNKLNVALVAMKAFQASNFPREQIQQKKRQYKQLLQHYVGVRQANRVQINEYFKDNYFNKENKNIKSFYTPNPSLIKYFNKYTDSQMMLAWQPTINIPPNFDLHGPPNQSIEEAQIIARVYSRAFGQMSELSPRAKQVVYRQFERYLPKIDDFTRKIVRHDKNIETLPNVTLQTLRPLREKFLDLVPSPNLTIIQRQRQLQYLNRTNDALINLILARVDNPSGPLTKTAERNYTQAFDQYYKVRDRHRLQLNQLALKNRKKALSAIYGPNNLNFVKQQHLPELKSKSFRPAPLASSSPIDIDQVLNPPQRNTNNNINMQMQNPPTSISALLNSQGIQQSAPRGSVRPNSGSQFSTQQLQAMADQLARRRRLQAQQQREDQRQEAERQQAIQNALRQEEQRLRAQQNQPQQRQAYQVDDDVEQVPVNRSFSNAIDVEDEEQINQARNNRAVQFVRAQEQRLDPGNQDPRPLPVQANNINLEGRFPLLRYATPRLTIANPQNFQTDTEKYRLLNGSNTSLRLSNKATVQAFPQWAAREAQRRKKVQDKRSNIVGDAEEIFNPAGRKMRKLNQFSSSLASYDDQTNQWVGKYPNAIKGKVKSSLAAMKKRQQSAKQLMDSKISKQQADKQIPLFIANIINANRSLSQSGIGQISKNSSALYAGRWVDSATGRIRVLPTANSKYLNPMSRAQKLGYLQAKILNHWNNLVSTLDETKVLNQLSDAQYQTRTRQSIVKALNLNLISAKFNTMINNKIQAFITETMPKSVVYYIMQRVPINQLKAIYQTYPNKITQDQLSTSKVDQDIINDKIKTWQQAINMAGKELMAQVTAANIDQTSKTRMQAKINTALLSLIASPTQSFGNAVKKLEKIAVVPMTMTEKDLLTLTQNVNSVDSQFKKLTQGRTYRGIPAATLTNIGQTRQKLNTILTKSDFAKKPEQILNHLKTLKVAIDKSEQIGGGVFRYSQPNLKSLTTGLFGER